MPYDGGKWREEIAFRRADLALRVDQARTARWSSPLVLAIFGAATAGFANAGLTWWNGLLENRRAENTRILEVLKTGNIEQADKNLKFMVAVGLISDKAIAERVKTYVTDAPPGTGPALPAYSYSAPAPSRRVPLTAKTPGRADSAPLVTEYHYTSPTVTEYTYTSPTVSGYTYTAPTTEAASAPTRDYTYTTPTVRDLAAPASSVVGSARSPKALAPR